MRRIAFQFPLARQQRQAEELQRERSRKLKKASGESVLQEQVFEALREQNEEFFEPSKQQAGEVRKLRAFSPVEVNVGIERLTLHAIDEER